MTKVSTVWKNSNIMTNCKAYNLWVNSQLIQTLIKVTAVLISAIGQSPSFSLVGRRGCCWLSIGELTQKRQPMLPHWHLRSICQNNIRERLPLSDNQPVTTFQLSPVQRRVCLTQVELWR
jgi:hypothetical protein